MKQIRVFRVLTRALGVLLLLGLAGWVLSLVDYPLPNWHEEYGLTGSPAPPLEEGSALGQPFRPPMERLSYLGLRFGTYTAQVQGIIELRLLSGPAPPGTEKEVSSRTLAREEIQASELVDNAVRRWDLGSLVVGEGKGLFLLVRRLKAGEDKRPLTLWLDSSPEFDQGPARLISFGPGGELKASELKGHLALTMGYDGLPSTLEVARSRPWWPVLVGSAGLAGLVFIFWPAGAGRKKRRPVLAWGAMVVVSLCLGLVAAEAGLRLMGFSFQLYLTEIQVGWPDPVKVRVSFLPDPDLIWVNKDYHYRLLKAARNRPQVIFSGDSCTDFGLYDKYLAELAAHRRPGQRLVYLNAGTGGWSSYQGRVQLERDLVELQPKVVTIYFGWNDHWASFGVEDKNIHKVALSSSVSLRNLRTIQLASKLLARKEARLGVNRVAIDDYQANLERMVEVCLSKGITPVLITAPSSHQKGREPEYLKQRFLRDLSELVPLHQAYLEKVRLVASENPGAVLCDLARRFAGHPQERLSRVLFKGDGVHPTPAGDRLIAAYLYDCFEAAGLWEKVFGGD